MSFSKLHLGDLNSQMGEAYHSPLFWLLSVVSKHEVICLSECPNPETMAHCVYMLNPYEKDLYQRASWTIVKWTGCLREVPYIPRGNLLWQVIYGQGDAGWTWNWSKGNWAVFKMSSSSFRPLMSQRFIKVLLPRVHVTAPVQGTPSWCTWSASSTVFAFWQALLLRFACPCRMCLGLLSDSPGLYPFCLLYFVCWPPFLF